MITIKLILPIVSLAAGLFYYFLPNVIWNNFFVLFHLKDKEYLYRSNKFIGILTIVASLFFVMIALFPSVLFNLLFLFWIITIAVLIPLSYELLWRFQRH